MPDKHFVGLAITGFKNNGKKRPISRVTLMVDNDNAVTAGDDTGIELAANCPHATQTMVDAILAQVKGYQYQMYSADDANLDPAAEPGDGVTVNGMYSVIARIDDDGSGYASISAPGEEEQKDEYPAAGPMTQQFDRQIAETRSQITKTAEQIRLEVANEVAGLSTSFTVELGKISARVDDAEGSIEVAITTLDGLTVTDSSGTTKIKGSSIETGTLYVSAANVTGTLTADQIKLTGSISWSDLSSSVQDDINDAYTMAEDAQTVANDVDDVVSGWSYVYRGTTYIDGEMLMTGTVTATKLQGGTVDILNASGSSVASMYIEKTSTVGLTIDSDYSLRLLSADNLYLEGENASLLMSGSGISVNCGWFVPSGTASYLGYPNRGMWQAVYSYTDTIQTSDRNKKHDIESLPDKYLDMLLDLSIYRFKMNTGTSDRYHVGYVAQDVEEYMNKHDIDSLEFGGFVKDADEDGNDIYMLRYGEFMAIHTMAIQKIYQRLEAAGL